MKAIKLLKHDAAIEPARSYNYRIFPSKFRFNKYQRREKQPLIDGMIEPLLRTPAIIFFIISRYLLFSPGNVFIIHIIVEGSAGAIIPALK